MEAIASLGAVAVLKAELDDKVRDSVRFACAGAIDDSGKEPFGVGRVWSGFNGFDVQGTESDRRMFV